jgi:hypothetical protein
MTLETAVAICTALLAIVLISTAVAGIVIKWMVRLAIRQYEMDEAKRTAHAVDGP